MIGTIMLLAMPPADASPDGAEWASAADPMGCMSCHFDSVPSENTDALLIEGLPDRVEAGRTYALIVSLSDPALKNAGFMLDVTTDGEPAGKLTAADEPADELTAAGEPADKPGAGPRTEANGATARQTRAGSVPAEPGRIRWQLNWTAPAPVSAPIRFDLWGNAGNDDLSPFGDRLHHRVWLLATEP